MKKIAALFIIIAALATALIGCSINRRPAPKPGVPPERMEPAPRQTPQDQLIPPTPDGTPAPATQDTLATKLAKTAESVEGVKTATVVVSGSTAFVGLELDSNVEDAKTNEIKTKTANVVKRADSRIKAVNVTTDSNLITRLKKVAQGIRNGRPVSSFAEELAEITRRITPKGTTK